MLLSKVIWVSSRSNLNSRVNCLFPYCKYDKLVSCTFLSQASFFYWICAFWLTGDPWVEDQENGSFPVLASCQELSPPSWQRVNSSADAPPHVSRRKIQTQSQSESSWQRVNSSADAPPHVSRRKIQTQPQSESSWQRVNSSADAPPRALSTSFVVSIW